MLHSAAQQLPQECSLASQRRARAPAAPRAPPGRARGAAVAPHASPSPAVEAAGAERAARGRPPAPRHSGEGKLLLRGLTFPELEQWCMAQGQPGPRAKQLWRWLWGGEAWQRRLEEPHRGQQDLSKPFRAWVAARASLEGGLQRASHTTAADGTTKLLHRLTDGEGAGMVVESVLIPKGASDPPGDKERGPGRARTTLCVSSQVGCAQNCQFCFTGRMGLRAQLSTAHIVQQVLEAQRFRAEHNAAARATAAAHALSADAAALIPPISSIVYMGMGEPLHNYEAVLASTAILTHPQGLQFSPNKVSVSTVGLLPEMRRFRAASPCQLALSLHATTDAVRDWLAPVNRRYPLGELLATLRELFPAGLAKRERRTVLVEYVMLAGVNDTLEDAGRLLQHFGAIEAKFNLIQFNPHAGTPFRASPTQQILAFRDVLLRGGRVCTVRHSRGDDEMAACGQLGALAAGARSAPTLQVPEGFRGAVGAPGAGDTGLSAVTVA